MDDRLRVAVIGGSRTASQLITDFVSRPFIEVVGVADVTDSSPGALTAQHFAIPFTTDIHQLGMLDARPDIVIDVCGRPHVNPALDETFPPDDTEAPTVIHSDVARLILTLAADSTALVPECMTSVVAAQI